MIVRLFILNLFLLTACGEVDALAQDDSAATPIEYQVDLAESRNHYIAVEIKVPVDGDQTELMMAVWTPGSYLVREYSRNIDSLEIKDAKGNSLDFEKTRKNRWLVETEDLEFFFVRYRVYCNELSVRTNWVGNSFAVLNGAPTFMTRPDRLDSEHLVRLILPRNWKRSATSLLPKGDQPNSYTAKDFDELVDSPIVAGNIQTFPFEVGGVPHQLVNVNDVGHWDGDRAARDLKKVVQAHHDMWGLVPYERYVFLNVIAESGGGLEHNNSCLMMTSRWTYRDAGRYKRWLSLASHEFFHTWNVRRLRPKSLVEYDYENEVYTRSLWVAEGITSYYEDLLLARAGFMSDTELMGILSRAISGVQNTEGRKLQSLGDASYDAWIKYYRTDENSSNTSISYYTKGAVAAFLLDTEIRRLTNNEKSLDNVMRLLYEKFVDTGYTPEDFRDVASEVANEDLSDWFKSTIDSPDELNYPPMLEWFGLRFVGRELGKPAAEDAKQAESSEEKEGEEGEEGEAESKPKPLIASWIKSFGKRLVDGRPAAEKRKGSPWVGFRTSGSEKVLVTSVNANSPATETGINTDDEIIAVDGYRVSGSVDSLVRRYEVGDEIELLIARRGELLTLNLTLGERVNSSWTLRSESKASKEQKKRFKSLLEQPKD